MLRVSTVSCEHVAIDSFADMFCLLQLRGLEPGPCGLPVQGSALRSQQDTLACFKQIVSSRERSLQVGPCVALLMENRKRVNFTVLLMARGATHGSLALPP